MFFLYRTSAWNSILAKDGHLVAIGCTPGRTVTTATVIGVSTVANWIFADISDAVPLKGLLPDTTLVFADNSSPMTSKPGERVTWVASLAAHFGRR